MGCSLVVAVDRCCATAREIKMIKKLAKEDRLVGGIMESNVFCIASQIGHNTLFLGSPGPITYQFLADRLPQFVVTEWVQNPMWQETRPCRVKVRVRVYCTCTVAGE